MLTRYWSPNCCSYWFSVTNCAIIQAPEGTTQFYAVEARPGAVSIWTDMSEAFAAMVQENAQRLRMINVVR